MATPTQNIPNIQSYEQYLSDMLSSYAAALGINDFNTGSINTSFFEAVALTAARASGDLLQTLNLFSVDRATGDALQRLALEYGVNPAQAQSAGGLVNIIDTSFTKISTTIYAGTPAPNIGATTINVSDASLFPASGSVYLGRGTPNIEGPIPYSIPPANVGSYWTITLSVATTKYHNLGESIILSQGGTRTIAANVIVVAPGVGTSPDIQYGVVAQAVILDGETEVDNVPVTALLPGSAGNVPADSIVAFASPPFPGASVINPLPFTTGTDNATDQQLRVQIKNALASQGLGTATAVEAALLGATATESSGIIDSIISDSLVTNTNGSCTVYIDNGTGYEETSNGVGLEFIVDSALGGEQFFQLQTGGTQAPVAQAYLQTELAEPYDLIGGDTLAVVVGGITYQHVFANADFASPGAATAYEVSASINADTALGFEASTAGNATFVIVRGKQESGEDVIFTTIPTTSGRNAAVLMGFPTSTIETLRLYKNGTPLSQDGITASVFTQAQQLWSNTIANGDTLILSVDGTAAITYTITNADFIATGLYTSVNNDNSLASWIQVFNNILTGVTATIVGDQIELTSNLGANNRANVTISPLSTLVNKGMFSATLGLSFQGAASDYTLDRNTAQFELVVPLVKGDQLSAGSAKTAAFVQSTNFSSNSITLASPAHIWILVDTAGQIIHTGVIANTTIAVSLPSTNIIRYTSDVPSAFDNVLPGDYIIIWSAELPSNDRLEGRVHAVTSTTVDVLVTPAEWAAAVVTSVINLSNGFVILRSVLAPQRFEVSAGTLTLDQVAAQLQTQTDELVFSVFLEKSLVITTNTIDPTGSVLIVTSDTQGQFLQLADGLFDNSKTSLIAFYDSQEFTGDLPLFIHSTFSIPEFANPPDSFIDNLGTTIVLDPSEPNNLICMLHPYGGIDDAQDFGECPQISSLSGNAVSIVPPLTPPTLPIPMTPDPYMHRVRTVDRFYVGSPLEFGYGDNLIAVIDGNVISQSYTIPMYRNALTNTTLVSNSTNFNAYDEDAGPTSSFTTYFNNFNFANFKVYMQAKKVLKPTPSQTAILYRAEQWGSSGEQVTVEYVYPTGPNQPIGSTEVIGSTVALSINLASGPVSSNSITSSTKWNIVVTHGVPSATIDQVTFIYAGQYTFTVTAANATVGAIYSNNGQNFLVTTTIAGGTTLVTTGLQGAPLTSGTLTKVSGTGDATITFSSFTFTGFGTAPALTLLGGEYANISTQTGFNIGNAGIFRVSTQAGFTPTATSFSVQAPAGQAISQSGVSTLVNGGILLYTASPTTAAQVATFVNANLASYVSATLVNDGGTSGAGVIVFSTYEDSAFTFSNVQLLDGVNWILSSNVSGSPQFVFKLPLSLPTDVGYAFNNGETLRLVPTTMEQVFRFISVLAVTGLSTVGTIELVDRGTRLELATQTLGSAGSIQIIGGSANSISLPVLNSAEIINNDLIEISVDSVASHFVTSDQWFRLQAANTQKKVTGFDFNTDVSVIASDPTTGEATIVISNSTLTQRNFGRPRNIQVQGDTFRVEKQGSLVCISWTGIGPNPMFESALNFNDSSGGTFNASLIAGTSDVQFIVESGNVNFTELSIGDFITIANQYIFTVTAANATAGAIYSNNGQLFTVSNTIVGGTTLTTTSTGIPATSGTLTKVSGTGDATITFSSFVAGTNISANNVGTFAVTGISANGKTIQVTNPDAKNQFSSGGFTFTGNANSGDQFVVGATTLIAGTNFVIGATSAATAVNLAAAIGLLPNLTASAIGSTVTTTATIPSYSTSLSYIPFSTTQVTVGAFNALAFFSGNFSATSGVSEGDTVILGPPFSPLNQGQYRVIREYNNSIWIQNPDFVEEEVNLSYNPVSLGFNTTTGFNVTVVNGLMHIEWNGTGTAPTLGNVIAGDFTTLGTNFVSANQGSFMVVDSSVALPQITELFLPSGAVFALSGAGTYFTIYSAGNAQKYYVWFNVNSTNTDPAPGGYTSGIQVAILSGDTSTNVASKTALALTISAFSVVSLNNTVTITTVSDIETNPTVNVNVPPPFEALTLQSGTRTFIEVINPGAVVDSSVSVIPATFTFTGNANTGDQFVIGANTLVAGTDFVIGGTSTTTAVNLAGAINALPNLLATANGTTVTVISTVLTYTPALSYVPSSTAEVTVGAGSTSGIFLGHRPQMQFFPYDASVPGDLFVVAGNVLTLVNAGSYPIVQVLNANTAIVKGNMASISNVNLENNVNSVYVEEGVAYSGYKHVYMVSAEPGTTTQSLIVFDTIAQYDKINPSAGVELTSLAKLNFNTTLKNGLDAYRYNTGLIAEANRIVYGDPRDPITYPGVGAAGADIFIKAPLTLRVTIAVDIRLLTGAPFPSIVQQVQSNVTALINSNPVGKSIDISSIVSVIRAIPGIISVAISSPLYSPTDDLIQVAPSEKALVLDPATDISVFQIGT